MKSILKLAVMVSAVLVSSCGKSDENNNYQGGDDSSLILGNVYNANSSVGKHFPKKMIQNEDRRGNETIFEVSNGKVTKIGSFLCEYEGNLLKKIKYSNGTTEREYFYSNGKISKVYWEDEGTWDYSYDSKKRLAKEIRTLPNGRQEITEYQYIDDNTVKTITNGQESTYIFANGNLVREETPNNTITYQYDNKNNWRYANKFSLVIDGPLATFLDPSYSSKNNVTKVVTSGNYGSDQVTFEYEYNSEGYPTKVTDSRGTVIQYEY